VSSLAKGPYVTWAQREIARAREWQQERHGHPGEPCKPLPDKPLSCSHLRARREGDAR
jgi:hypothetical protein